MRFQGTPLLQAPGSLHTCKVVDNNCCIIGGMHHLMHITRSSGAPLRGTFNLRPPHVMHIFSFSSDTCPHILLVS